MMVVQRDAWMDEMKAVTWVGHWVQSMVETLAVKWVDEKAALLVVVMAVELVA